RLASNHAAARPAGRRRRPGRHRRAGVRPVKLPTRDEMFANTVQLRNQAYKALGDAADWLRSDWTPTGAPLTDEQAAWRTRMWRECSNAKDAINRDKDRHY